MLISLKMSVTLNWIWSLSPDKIVKILQDARYVPSDKHAINQIAVATLYFNEGQLHPTDQQLVRQPEFTNIMSTASSVDAGRTKLYQSFIVLLMHVYRISRYTRKVYPSFATHMDVLMKSIMSSNTYQTNTKNTLHPLAPRSVDPTKLWKYIASLPITNTDGFSLNLDKTYLNLLQMDLTSLPEQGRIYIISLLSQMTTIMGVDYGTLNKYALKYNITLK